MNNHRSEEQLILFYYGEDHGREATAAHLETCETCRRAYQDLHEFLANIETGPVPERGPGYGAEVWNRLSPRLAKETIRANSLFKPGRRAALIAAIAAALIMAFLLGRFVSEPRLGPEPWTRAQAHEAGQRVLVSTVRSHLDAVQMFLIDFANNGQGPTVGSHQGWARDLADDNRLYRQAAHVRGDQEIVDFLDQLELTLLEIANGDKTDLSSDIQAIRDGDHVEILFKIRFFDKTQLKTEQPNQQLQNI